MFTYALEVANAHKDNSIMIGDNLEADIEGALSIGMQAIHCNFDNTSHNKSNILSVSSLLEIKQYL